MPGAFSFARNPKGEAMKNTFSLGIAGLILGFILDSINSKKGEKPNENIPENGGGESGRDGSSQQSASSEKHSPGIEEQPEEPEEVENDNE